MRLATYESPRDGGEVFGVVIAQEVFSLAALQRESEVEHPALSTMYTFVSDPATAQPVAQRLVDFCQERVIEGDRSLPPHERVAVDEARFLPPLPTPSGLLDFGLTPKHIYSAGMTFVRREYKGLKRIIARQVVRAKLRRAMKSRIYLYYIGNHNVLVGDGDTVGWPRYTSYLDIEPELAVVTGPPDHAIAGYTILNDLSARDVQMPELEALSLTRSKHFDRGNGMGPFLVTPDEVGDPRKLGVTVRVGDRFEWKGSTSEYSASPEDVIRQLRGTFTPVPGVVMGMGTVPGCCGLDNDLWPLPGEAIEITFDKLGTLRQKMPQRISVDTPSRWGERLELGPYLEQDVKG